MSKDAPVDVGNEPARRERSAALQELAKLEELAGKSQKLDGEKLLGRWAVKHLATIREALASAQG